jgi:hypothetical protein
MATLTKGICQDVINGDYHDGPQGPYEGIVKIVTYNNMFNGGLEYASVHKKDYFMRYEESPACHNVKTVWTPDMGRVTL